MITAKQRLQELLERRRHLPIVRMAPESDNSRPLALSYAQQRLWFLHQYTGPNAVYNIPLALRLRGEVDEAALLGSLEALHQRHEALRTRFVSLDGDVVQVIDPPEIELEVEAVSAADVRAIAHRERLYGFDLSSERLCRIRVLREMDGERSTGVHVLLVTMHHSISDGWSLGIFLRELMSLYRAYTNGEGSPLVPLPVQYADYADWQRRWLQGEVLDEQMSYWRGQLAGLAPLLTLPTDRPRPAEQSFRGRTEEFVAPASLMEKLQALSREQGVTLYMTLLSSFAVLLGRYAGQPDVAVGTPVANRTRHETEGLIGFFVNTLVMRHDLSGDPRFVDLLKRTREMALQAYAHQDVPFEQLVEALNPERNVGHSPLFQVMFALQNVPLEQLDLPGLVVEPLSTKATEEDGDAGEGVARFDLTLSLRETPDGLAGGLEYNTDLFDRATVRRMLDHYARLLEAVVAAPQSRLSRLEILGAEERRQQLIDWNATARAYPADKCIHELLEEQAARAPEAVAVVFEDQVLTYGELNRRANQLAHCLIEQGVGPEVVVGLCLERSADMVVGLLGILKAGGAYLPLDPSYPPERLAYMLSDAGVTVLVTQEALATVAGPFEGAVVRLDVDHERIERQPPTAPPVLTVPENLAYVIYTSGSTGNPKGVAVNHRNVANLVAWALADLGRERLARVWATTSLNFDVSVFELFATLCNGGTIELMADVLALTDGAPASGGLLCTVPSALTALMSDGTGWAPSAIGFAGESLTDAILEQAAIAFPGCETLNLYGPTEATVYVVFTTNPGGGSIGRPISNTRAYVLDGDLRLSPVGVAGEFVHCG